MATEGPYFPASVATQAGASGVVDWTTPTNALTDNTTNASWQPSALGQFSYELKVYDFQSFATVGDTDTVTDIKVVIDLGTSGASKVVDVVQLGLINAANFTLVSDNKAGLYTGANSDQNVAGAVLPREYSGTVASYWNVTGGLTGADIKGANFGVLLQLQESGGTAQGRLDYISLEITYTAGGAHTITGAVTHTLTPAATMLEGRVLAGSVAHTLNIAATMDADFTHAIAGAVAHSIAIAASMAYSSGAMIAGAVTLTLTPSAAMDVDRLHTLAGAVSLPLGVGAAMEYAAFGSFEIAGAVSFALAVAAAMDVDRQHVLAGAVPFSLTPAAAFDVDFTHAIAGSVPFTLTPAATMTFAGVTYELVGAVTHILTPGAMMDVDRLHTLAGSVTHTLTPAAGMDSDLGYSLTGAVIFALAVAGSMVVFDPIARVWRVYATVPDERVTQITVSQAVTHAFVQAGEPATFVRGN